MGTDLVSGFGSGGTIGVLQRDQIACERLADMMALAEDMVRVGCSFSQVDGCNGINGRGGVGATMDTFYSASRVLVRRETEGDVTARRLGLDQRGWHMPNAPPPPGLC